MTKLTDDDGVQIFQTPEEVENLKQLLSQCNVPGELFEVGVFMGATAKIIASAYPFKTLYAFDTFEGFPDEISTEKGDDIRYRVGDMKEATIEQVKENLKNYENIVLTKGTFPDTAKVIKDKTFAFAHIDVDLYQGTKDALEFIIPRMNKGGIILIHDYPAHEGVKKAVEELNLKVENLGGRQACIKI